MTFDAGLLSRRDLLHILFLDGSLLGRDTVADWLSVLHVRACLVDLAVQCAFIWQIVIDITHRCLEWVEILRNDWVVARQRHVIFVLRGSVGVRLLLRLDVVLGLPTVGLR